MTSITIDKNAALSLLEQVVDDAAPITGGYDFVEASQYRKDLGLKALEGPSCFYSHGDKPGCIVGQALHLAGVPLDTLAALDTSTGKGITTGSTINLVRNYLASEFDVHLTEGARIVFRAAQDAQDNGLKWSNAVEAAKESAVGVVD